MRLVQMSDLYRTLDILKDDAAQLVSGSRDDIGTIELVEDWENQVPRLIHRYDKLITKVYNSFRDPEGEDEIKWIDAHFHMTKDFLIRHGLAKEINNENDV